VAAIHGEDTRSGGAACSGALTPDGTRFGSRLPGLRAMTVAGEAQPLCSSSTVVSGRVRLARSDAARVFGTGAACRRFD
jgi:phage protein U